MASRGWQPQPTVTVAIGGPKLGANPLPDQNQKKKTDEIISVYLKLITGIVYYANYVNHFYNYFKFYFKRGIELDVVQLVKHLPRMQRVLGLIPMTPQILHCGECNPSTWR